MKLICDCGREIDEFEAGVNGSDFCKCSKCGKEYNIMRGDEE